MATNSMYSPGMKLALHASLLGSVAALPKDALPDEAKLARERIGGVTPGVVRDAVFDHDGTFEALWEKEFKLAQKETARLLQAGALNSMLTSNPTTAAPTTSIPTAAPGEETTPPTPEPGQTGTPTQIVTATPTQASTTQSPDGGQTDIPTSSPGTDPPGTAAPNATFAPTEEGGCLDGGTINEYLLSRLTAITEEALLTNPSTPQGKAYEFMVNDPFLREQVCTYPTIDQRYGLATFYYSTNGAEWEVNTDWLGNMTECEWFGVVCADDIMPTNLTLSENNLSGPLPNEISTLFMLDRIEVFDNLLSSTLPTGLANLTQLNVLDLEMNALTGPAFPSDVFGMTNLKQVFFSRNSFTGTIPNDITKWTGLQDFWAAENKISGGIPTEIANLTDLQSIILYDNLMENPIPEEIGLLSNLSNLQLYRNAFNGFFPSALYQLTGLKVLLLDNNFLSGVVTSDLANLSQLTDLRINNNYIGGSLPDEIGFLTGLKFLTLGVNFFTGSIPNSLTLLTSLETFDASGSFHTGPIPDTIFSLPEISRIYLNGNGNNNNPGLTGTIPDTWSSPPKLVDLFLNNNQLTGTLPDIEKGQLTMLTELVLQFNNITGSVPESVCALRNDGVLDRIFVDCGGSDPEIECDFPTCCNRCFEGEPTRRRRHLEAEQELENKMVLQQAAKNQEQQVSVVASASVSAVRTGSMRQEVGKAILQPE